MNLHKLLLFLLLLFFHQVLLAQDDALDLANAQLAQIAKKKHYLPTDITHRIITDDYTSGGIRHIYYQQSIGKIAIYGAFASVHLKGNQIISSNLHFIPQLEKRKIQSQFQVQALEAIEGLAQEKQYPLNFSDLEVVKVNDENESRPTTISSAGISSQEIPMELVYFQNADNDLRLAWSIYIDEIEGGNYKNFLVDAETSGILQEVNLTLSCNFNHAHHQHLEEEKCNAPIDYPTMESFTNTDSSYNVVHYLIESPNFGNRSLVMNPWENQMASPLGWHSLPGGVNHEYTIGNNIDAYEDKDNNNMPTNGNGSRAHGGSNLVFDFNWDSNGSPGDYIDAAITNLFYVANVAHDIFYNYGFDEASGNFQTNNFGRGGLGNDHVFCEAQDASSICNANMKVPIDGSNPRLQMMLCSGRDSDFDNGIILHEYGHGVTIRLTGGPQTDYCLKNIEQMGEGWSDFFGILVTMKSSDTAATNRTVGTWVNGSGPNDGGIRLYPYTTDMSVNPMTYKTIDDPGVSRPHGVGSVWATMLWDMNWALIDQYGWDADVYNGTGGNNMALRLVMEALKLQPCFPGFVDARDAILAADLALYGGANRCLLWNVFARRGLGYSANQGSSHSRTDGWEAYDLPSECTIELKHSVDRDTAFLGERLTFQLEVINHQDTMASNIVITDTLPENVQFYEASDGGVLTANVVRWPAFNLVGKSSKTFQLKVEVNDIINFDPNFLDDCENGTDNWAVIQISDSMHQDNNWLLQDTVFKSPTMAWFGENVTWSSETQLILAKELGLTDTSKLIFEHSFSLEDSYDFGEVDISVDGGKTWINLEPYFIQNGYNKMTQYGHNAYTNSSTTIAGHNAGFITSIINLSAFAGKVAKIRFRLITDTSDGWNGWFIDDVSITNTNYVLSNYSNIRNDSYYYNRQVAQPTIIDRTMVNHTVRTKSDTLLTIEDSLAYVNVQQNDIDTDAPTDTLVTTLIQLPSNGTATVIDDDSIRYLPNLEFSGRDTLLYQVCDILNACEIDTVFIFVAFVNDPPVANTDFYTINENSTNHHFNVLMNDSSPNEPGDTLITQIVEGPKHGTALIINEDSIQYAPLANYFGGDTIIYAACDTLNLCDEDTVFISILEINKAPTTQPDYIRIAQNSINQIIDVQANDDDPNGAGDSLITSIIIPPSHGIATVIQDKDISYTPNTGYSGLDTILYQVCDTANLCATDTIFISIEFSFTCQADNLIKNETGIASGDYIASNQITSAGIINSGDTVRFVAVNSINLLDGFEIKSGAVFTALIDNCVQAPTNNLFKPIAQNVIIDTPLEANNSLNIRPNPFNYQTIIDYELAKSGRVQIVLYDISGQMIRILVDEQNHLEGKHQFILDADVLPAGVYWTMMKTQTGILTKKVFRYN